MMLGMTSGPYPPAQPTDGPGRSGGWPGLYPLRPLTVGEILGGGLKIAAAGASLLLPLGIGLGVLTRWVQLAVAAWVGDLTTYARFGAGTGLTVPTTMDAAGRVVPEVPPLWTWWPLIALSIVSGIGALVINGVAGSVAAEAGLRRPAMGAVKARLAGRWGALTLVALAAFGITLAGLILLVIPGIIAQVTLMFAAMAVTVEGLSGGAALRRSADLTRGRRWPLFLKTLLIGLIVGVIGVVVTQLLHGLLDPTGSVATLLIADTVDGAISGALSIWSAGVVAMLYVDTRFRAEGLDGQLRGWAARGPLEK